MGSSEYALIWALYPSNGKVRLLDNTAATKTYQHEKKHEFKHYELASVTKITANSRRLANTRGHCVTPLLLTTNY